MNKIQGRMSSIILPNYIFFLFYKTSTSIFLVLDKSSICFSVQAGHTEKCTNAGSEDRTLDWCLVELLRSLVNDL